MIWVRERGVKHREMKIEIKWWVYHNVFNRTFDFAMLGLSMFTQIPQKIPNS